MELGAPRVPTAAMIRTKKRSKCCRKRRTMSSQEPTYLPEHEHNANPANSGAQQAQSKAPESSKGIGAGPIKLRESGDNILNFDLNKSPPPSPSPPSSPARLPVLVSTTATPATSASATTTKKPSTPATSPAATTTTTKKPRGRPRGTGRQLGKAPLVHPSTSIIGESKNVGRTITADKKSAELCLNMVPEGRPGFTPSPKPPSSLVRSPVLASTSTGRPRGRPRGPSRQLGKAPLAHASTSIIGESNNVGRSVTADTNSAELRSNMVPERTPEFTLSPRPPSSPVRSPVPASTTTGRPRGRPRRTSQQLGNAPLAHTATAISGDSTNVVRSNTDNRKITELCLLMVPKSRPAGLIPLPDFELCIRRGVKKFTVRQIKASIAQSLKLRSEQLVNVYLNEQQLDSGSRVSELINRCTSNSEPTTCDAGASAMELELTYSLNVTQVVFALPAEPPPRRTRQRKSALASPGTS